MLMGKKEDKDSNKGASCERHIIPILLVVLAVFYNAFLATINANFIAVNTVCVALTEILILLGIAGYVTFNSHKLVYLLRHISFFAVMVLLSIMVMFANGELYVKFIRAMFIVVIFVMLGSMTKEKDIIRIFKILTAVTLFVAVIEIFKTDLYVSILQPALYYMNTRGILPYETHGLWRGSTRLDHHFSFNFLSNHRISSIFLEQVSLANFSMVISIFMISFWKSLTRKELLFFIFTALFLISANDTRTGTVFVLSLIPGFFIFHRLPRNWNVLFVPAILIVSVILFYDPSFDKEHWTDDFSGRVGLTLFTLSKIDISTAIIGKSAYEIARTMDSGYVYLIYSSSLLGAILYWLYTSLLVSSRSEAGKRFAYATSLFIAVNLMIGAAIFTIKIGAPLWLMGGFFLQQTYIEKGKQKKKGLSLSERLLDE